MITWVTNIVLKTNTQMLSGFVNEILELQTWIVIWSKKFLELTPKGKNLAE